MTPWRKHTAQSIPVSLAQKKPRLRAVCVLSAAAAAACSLDGLKGDLCIANDHHHLNRGQSWTPWGKRINYIWKQKKQKRAQNTSPPRDSFWPNRNRALNGSIACFMTIGYCGSWREKRVCLPWPLLHSICTHDAGWCCRVPMCNCSFCSEKR